VEQEDNSENEAEADPEAGGDAVFFSADWLSMLPFHSSGVIDLVRFVSNLDSLRGFADSALSGMTRRQIDSFPTNFLPEKHEAVACCVCLEDMVKGQEIRRLPCLHYFHIPCIDEWLAKSPTCPIDKTKF